MKPVRGLQITRRKGPFQGLCTWRVRKTLWLMRLSGKFQGYCGLIEGSRGNF